MVKKTKEELSNITLKNFIWFGNDADGLSIIDFLAAGMFIFFLVAKIVHFVLSIQHIGNADLIQQMNLMMADINQNMYVIITGYFVKKSIDTTVTKIGLFRAGEYEKAVTSAQKQYSNSVTTNELPDYDTTSTQTTDTSYDVPSDMSGYESYTEDSSGF